MKFHGVGIMLVLALASIITSGCSGDKTVTQAARGTISGVVMDQGGSVVSTAVVTAKDTSGGLLLTATTDSSGAYTLQNLPAGPIVLGVSKDSYTSPADQTVGVLADRTVPVNPVMTATGLALAFDGQLDPVSGSIPYFTSSVNTEVSNKGYGTAAEISVTPAGLIDSSSSLTYSWKNFQIYWGSDWASAPSGTVTGSGAKATIKFASMAECFAPRSASTGEHMAGYTLPNRLGPLAISSDKRGLIPASVTVKDNHGQAASIIGEVFATNKLTGLRTVALGERIYLNRGNDDASQIWALTAKPNGSSAVLSDTASRTPFFIPDVSGTYLLSVGGQVLSITAGTYSGVITGVASSGAPEVDSLCLMCHNGTVAPDKFTPWTQTKHASMFSTTAAAAPFVVNMNCANCHSVGGDSLSSKVNGGFPYVAKAMGYSYNRIRSLKNPATDAFPDMVKNFPAAARLMNIQCESCHGPQNSAAHAADPNAFSSGRVSYAAELCISCHYDRLQWTEIQTVSENSGQRHLNRERALLVGSDSDCGRCHSAQGFVAYIKQLGNNNVGTITDARWSAVSAANVEPVTCTACHDPHGGGNSHQTRVSGKTPVLPAGFSMTGIGQGALCVVCHATAQGALDNGASTWLHEDTSRTFPNYNAPHGSQGDVFAGRNAWFMGSNLPMMSKHATITDTCVACHMQLNPTTNPTVKGYTTHQFYVESSTMSALCNKCHGGINSNISPSAISASFQAGLEALEIRLQQAALAKIQGAANNLHVNRAVDANGAVIGIDGTGTFAGAAVNQVNLVTTGNQIGLNLVLSSPATIGGKSVNTLSLEIGSLIDTGTGQALYLPGSNFVKGTWNYFLVKKDKSLGVHNFTFVQSVINTTFAQSF
jgi:hypothetical protein